MTEELVSRFAQTYVAAQAALNKNDRQSALIHYQQLLELYRQMEGADIEGIHRELAHDRLSAIYDHLTNAVQESARPAHEQRGQDRLPSAQTTQQPASTQSPTAPPGKSSPAFSSTELMLIGFLALIVGIIVFIKPEVIGLAVLEGGQVTLPVDVTFSNNGPLKLSLASTPASLKITGSVVGSGNARVYVVTPEGRKLLFHSELVETSQRGDERTFALACVDTCILTQAPRDITLEVEVDRAVLRVDSLTYTTRIGSNRAPRYVSTADGITLAVQTPTTLDMSQLFVDDDGDVLGYIVGAAPGVGVSVTGDKATLTGIVPGNYDIALVASDGQVATRVPLHVSVR